MSAERARRVGDLLRELLSELVARDVKDPRIKDVLFTDVKMSPDLRQARVYFSVVVGGEAARASAGLALERARGFLRREVGRRVRLRAIPELEFVPDGTAEYAAHIDQVLTEIHAADAAAAAADAPPAQDGPPGAASVAEDAGDEVEEP